LIGEAGILIAPAVAIAGILATFVAPASAVADTCAETGAGAPLPIEVPPF
jgi:hypothetical protein